MIDLEDSTTLAAKRRGRAEKALHRAASLGETTRAGREAMREAFHWLRAARSADAGMSAPQPYRRGGA